ncbi:MAG: CxxxxCH/CxxCH domain-containing protein [Proteobacteria bacterium]|nr:CxxxxCH/CxxCH domain-containing protein [Pseudomonadota bacterium]
MNSKIGTYLCGLWVMFLLAGCGGSSGGGEYYSTSSTGVAVDPYIVGAVFQEVSGDGMTVLQRQSGPSDESGVFRFPKALTPGSIVEMKVSNRGLHGGAPYQGMLRRRITTSDRSSVNVTPLTTLLTNGTTEDDLLFILNEAGFPGISAADLYENPMTRPQGGGRQDLQNMTSGVDDSMLTLLQANMAVNDYMEITGNFQVTGNDLQRTSQATILNSVSNALRSRLNAAEYNRIKNELAQDPQLTGQPTLGDMIMAVLQQQQTLVASTKEDMSVRGTFDPGLVNQTVTDGKAQLVAMVKEQHQLGTQPPAGSGVTLYADYCAMCHNALSSSSKKNRTSAQIQAAITNNIGGMGYLSTLTASEIQAITDVLTTNQPPPTTPADGATLYSGNCAGCHGQLAATGKPGRTAAQIQAAIDNNIGNMGYLNTLTTVEVQAIADALPAAQPPDPTTPPDGVALYNSECAGCHSPLANTGKPGRTAAQIQAAINNNVGSMGYLNTLTTVEVQAIADALPAAQPPDPTTPPDGTALYAGNCAGCHGSLANTTKPGRTAAQIQAAINNNVGSMGYLNTLSTAEVQAIADVLPPATTPGPDYGDCTACHGQPPSGNSYPNTAGAHAVHTSLPSVNNDCTTCHVGAAHNGQLDLGFPASYNARSGTATDNSNGTCSSISCHGGITTPVWATGSITVNTQCTSCHSSGTSQYNDYSSGQHNKHMSKGYSCTVCHNTTKLQVGHFSNLATTAFEQSAASTIGGGSTSVGLYQSGSCSSINCHGSKRW